MTDLQIDENRRNKFLDNNIVTVYKCLDDKCYFIPNDYSWVACLNKEEEEQVYKRFPDLKKQGTVNTLEGKILTVMGSKFLTPIISDVNNFRIAICLGPDLFRKSYEERNYEFKVGDIKEADEDEST